MTALTIGTSPNSVSINIANPLDMPSGADVSKWLLEHWGALDTSGVQPDAMKIPHYSWNGGENTYTFYNDINNKLRCSVNRNSDGSWQGHLSDFGCWFLYVIILGSPTLVD